MASFTLQLGSRWPPHWRSCAATPRGRPQFGDRPHPIFISLAFYQHSLLKHSYFSGFRHAQLVGANLQSFCLQFIPHFCSLVWEDQHTTFAGATLRPRLDSLPVQYFSAFLCYMCWSLFSPRATLSTATGRTGVRISHVP